MDSYQLDSLTGVLGFLGIFAVFILLFFVAFLVVYIVGVCKLYQKAGKSGWEAIVPFYNTWVLVEIAGLAWWWFFIVGAVTIVSFLNIDDLESVGFLASLFGSFCCNYNLSKKLHQDTGFAVLMTIFPFVMMPLIGFSNRYQFDSKVFVSDVGPFGRDDAVTTDSSSSSVNEEDNPDKKEKKESKSEKRFCPNCGNEVNEEHQYCNHCGTKLK